MMKQFLAAAVVAGALSLASAAQAAVIYITGDGVSTTSESYTQGAAASNLYSFDFTVFEGGAFYLNSDLTPNRSTIYSSITLASLVSPGVYETETSGSGRADVTWSDLIGPGTYRLTYSLVGAGSSVLTAWYEDTLPTPVPLPAAAPLLLAGIGGLGLLARRKKKAA